jgi:septal ring factor EnvC (AmiA/AmiB activator)
MKVGGLPGRFRGLALLGPCLWLFGSNPLFAQLPADQGPAHKSAAQSRRLEPIPDLRSAVPARELSRLPSTAQQYRALRSEIAVENPAVQSARQKSNALKLAAETVRWRLIETAARIQQLETNRIAIKADILSLTAQEKALDAGFQKDRASVARLLALIERVQVDMPPAIALKPEDALGAARGVMLVGATLPEVYGAAAALARRLRVLRSTHADLLQREQEALQNAANLKTMRLKLDQLLAIREAQSAAAASTYGDLRTRLDLIATRATDLRMLLQKVSDLRSQPQSEAPLVGRRPGQGRELFLKPVVGPVVPPAEAEAGAPGVTFATAPAAQVVSPADAKVLFSGPYHKYGHVLILATALGYDAVLAGLDRVDVHPGDQVLAGEPVGTMSGTGPGARLYFELRQSGHGINPAPLMTLDLRKARRT